MGAFDNILVVDKDKSPVVLAYMSKDAAGFDICATKTVEIPPGGRVLVSTGLHLLITGEVPLFELQIRIRSGLSLKSSLMVVNSPGCVDMDFLHPNEIKVIMGNFGTEPYTVMAGDRVAQGIFSEVFRPGNPTLDVEKRSGGFGSTGK